MQRPLAFKGVRRGRAPYPVFAWVKRLMPAPDRQIGNEFVPYPGKWRRWLRAQGVAWKASHPHRAATLLQAAGIADCVDPVL